MNLLMQIKYFESIDPGLSKTGLGMSLRLFVMILWSFEVLSSWVEKEGGVLKKSLTNSFSMILLRNFLFLILRRTAGKCARRCQ